MDIGSRIGPYEIKERIGEGGMAVVYKVWHTGLHRFEALKVPRFQGTQSIHPDFIQRLLSEARIAAQLHHPHIVAIHSVSEPESPVQFFAMDLIEGRDLAEVLQQRHQLPLPEVIAVIRQVASALDYAHSRGFIHRDIKPGNILLGTGTDTAWNAKVVDFGISRAAEDSGGTRLTKSGMIVGTPEYMSPEQAGSGALVDYRTDIYSLGIVAYEMLTGHPPFTAGDGVSRMSILLSHVHHLPRPPVEEIPNLSQAANNAVLKALAKAPDERFQSCAEFIQALAGEVLVASPSTAGLTPSAPLTPPGLPRPDSLTPPTFLAPPQATAMSSPVMPPTTAPEMAVLTETVQPPRPANLDAATAEPLLPPPAPVPDATNTAPRHARRRKPTPFLLSVLGVSGLALLGATIFAFTRGNSPPAVVPASTPTPPSPVATVTAPIIAATRPAPVVEATTEATPTEAAMPTDVATPTDIAPASLKPQVQRLKLTRAIAFPTQIEKTAALPVGQKKLKQVGRAGQKEVTIEVVRQGSRQLSRSIVGSRTLKAPVPQIELLGTAPPKIKPPLPRHSPAPRHAAPRHTTIYRQMPRYHPPIHRSPAHHNAAPHHVREAPLPP